MTTPQVCDPWPLRHLVLRTPRLELRPDDDEGLLELVAAARAGVHPPGQMPFAVAWTDASPAQIGIGTLQYHWSRRAALRAEAWDVHFLVRFEGRVIGTQGLSATDFAVTREVSSGSWIGLAHQRLGLGTEMRAAILALAFDHLGARTARSTAFTDNVASLTVSRRLGYVEDGSLALARRGRAATEVRLLLTPETFVPPTWTVAVSGLDACRGMLGASPA